MKFAIWGAALVLPCAAAAFEPTLPEGAAQSAEAINPATSYRLLTGPWQAGDAPRIAIEGPRTDSAWRLRANQMTTLQILAPLREQIAVAGYEILYECETDGCGGFDFRYELGLLPEPEMHVDLSDFRYLAARNGSDYLALTVSRSSESGFIHLTTLAAQPIAVARPENPLAQNRPVPELPPTSLGTALETEGSVVLEDLVFESGKSTLEGEDFPTLAALADYLSTRPEARVTLVGHTDTIGGLAPNIAISRQRAESVRARLIERYGVAPEQLGAEGAGWLAPRASNQTAEGQAKNRRVEAILTSTPS